ncbi:MAG: hypothetical protein ACJA09_003017 [Alcanivorax sp.]|jgi:hypothetical protein
MLLMSSVVSAGSYKLPLDADIGVKLSNLPENGRVKLSANEFEDVWTPLGQRPTPKPLGSSLRRQP